MGTSSPVLVQLRRVAKTTGRSVAEILQYYAMERFLFRLGVSDHARSFVLKGALLQRVWDTTSCRSTRDIDFLAFGDNDPERVMRIVQEILSLDLQEESVEFDRSGIQLTAIKEHDEYQGVRVKFAATIESAKIPMQLDIGFGDSVRPAIVWEDYPTLLPDPAPRIRIYSRESIVAEKTHAMVKLGLINSRLKDYFDIWHLSRRWPFVHSTLVEAIQATFHARATGIPTELAGLSPEYVRNHQDMWRNYLKKTGLVADDLEGVVAKLETFLLPCLEGARTSEPRNAVWDPEQACWE